MPPVELFFLEEIVLLVYRDHLPVYRVRLEERAGRGRLLEDYVVPVVLPEEVSHLQATRAGAYDDILVVFCHRAGIPFSAISPASAVSASRTSASWPGYFSGMRCWNSLTHMVEYARA